MCVGCPDYDDSNSVCVGRGGGGTEGRGGGELIWMI